MKLTLDEMCIQLRKREEIKLTDDEIISHCFSVIGKHSDIVARCHAAVLLSGIVKPGLGKTTKDFLKENPNLPIRVQELLSSSIMRMEGF
jgi:hypothetical protein